LTIGPRVEDGELQLSAEKVDVSRLSGDAFARGNVKASWLGSAPRTDGRSAQGAAAFGGQGPAHVVASEAQLHEATGEATFRGQVRLWQQGNSISAPVLVLDRTRQTLVARSATVADPVRVVLVSAANLGLDSVAGAKNGNAAPTATPPGPSVIRVRGSDLKYSEAERKVVMHSRDPGGVVAETGTSTSTSSEVELLLLPPGNHAAKDGGSAQVDRMTARGDVTVSSQGRRGTGEQLVYTSETGNYVMTGTAAAPPKVTDPSHGTVTGEALVFNSRDDSVSIEGGGQQTTTNTTAPK
jgi:lipopolysaccharide export system protein LptA